MIGGCVAIVGVLVGRRGRWLEGCESEGGGVLRIVEEEVWLLGCRLWLEHTIVSVLQGG